MSNAKLLLSTLAAASVLAMAGCGGGSDGDAAPAAPTGGGNTVTSLAISGTAATGAAIAGGTVDVKCATGTATATTAANGTYTLDVRGGALPCALRVTSGSTVLHSLVAVPPSAATVAFVANITPLTELLVAHVAGGSPETLFTAFDATAQARITPAAVSTAVATTLAALQGTVDLTGIDPIGDALVAATGNTAGNALDATLDKLAAALAASQTTLATLSTAIATSTTTSSAVLQQIAPPAASCAALRSGTYRIINPHETANDLAYATYRLVIDATTLKITDAEPTHAPESVTMAPVADSPCRFTYEGEFGTETALVSPAGIIVVRSPSSTGPLRTSLLVPEQTIPLAQLAGTFNYMAYVREGSGVLTPSNGTMVIDAAGKFVSGTECVGLACTTSAATDLPSPLTANAAGGFDIAGESGGTARAFAFKTADGTVSLFVLDPNQGGLSVFTQQAALKLPAVGQANSFWDFTVGSGSFAWAPPANSDGGASALTESVTTVTEVDSAAQAFTRIRASDQRIDVNIVNSPRDGVRSRPAAKNASATFNMPLGGTGILIYSSVAANQNFFGISVNRP